jgi:transposase
VSTTRRRKKPIAAKLRDAEAITAAHARVVFLPPYSPDFNPIELVLSKLKWLLTSASIETVEALWSVCGDML